MQTLTDRDLSRLLTLQYVHGGELRHIPHGVGESFDAMGNTELVRIDSEELVDGSVLATHATITDKGRRVAEAGMMAMKEAIANG